MPALASLSQEDLDALAAEQAAQDAAAAQAAQDAAAAPPPDPAAAAPVPPPTDAGAAYGMGVPATDPAVTYAQDPAATPVAPPPAAAPAPAPVPASTSEATVDPTYAAPVAPPPAPSTIYGGPSPEGQVVNTTQTQVLYPASGGPANAYNVGTVAPPPPTGNPPMQGAIQVSPPLKVVNTGAGSGPGNIEPSNLTPQQRGEQLARQRRAEQDRAAAGMTENPIPPPTPYASPSTDTYQPPTNGMSPTTRRALAGWNSLLTGAAPPNQGPATALGVSSQGAGLNPLGGTGQGVATDPGVALGLPYLGFWDAPMGFWDEPMAPDVGLPSGGGKVGKPYPLPGEEGLFVGVTEPGKVSPTTVKTTYRVDPVTGERTPYIPAGEKAQPDPGAGESGFQARTAELARSVPTPTSKPASPVTSTAPIDGPLTNIKTGRPITNGDRNLLNQAIATNDDATTMNLVGKTTDELTGFAPPPPAPAPMKPLPTPVTGRPVGVGNVQREGVPIAGTTRARTAIDGTTPAPTTAPPDVTAEEVTAFAKTLRPEHIQEIKTPTGTQYQAVEAGRTTGPTFSSDKDAANYLARRKAGGPEILPAPEAAVPVAVKPNWREAGYRSQAEMDAAAKRSPTISPFEKGTIDPVNPPSFRQRVANDTARFAGQVPLITGLAGAGVLGALGLANGTRENVAGLRDRLNTRGPAPEQRQRGPVDAPIASHDTMASFLQPIPDYSQVSGDEGAGFRRGSIYDPNFVDVRPTPDIHLIHNTGTPPPPTYRFPGEGWARAFLDQNQSHFPVTDASGVENAINGAGAGILDAVTDPTGNIVINGYDTGLDTGSRPSLDGVQGALNAVQQRGLPPISLPGINLPVSDPRQALDAARRAIQGTPNSSLPDFPPGVGMTRAKAWPNVDIFTAKDANGNNTVLGATNEKGQYEAFPPDMTNDAMKQRLDQIQAAKNPVTAPVASPSTDTGRSPASASPPPPPASTATSPPPAATDPAAILPLAGPADMATVDGGSSGTPLKDSNGKDTGLVLNSDGTVSQKSGGGYSGGSYHKSYGSSGYSRSSGSSRFSKKKKKGSSSGPSSGMWDGFPFNRPPSSIRQLVLDAIASSQAKGKSKK